MNDNIRPAATHCRDAAMRRATSAQRATRSSVVAIGGPDSRGTPDEVVPHQPNGYLRIASARLWVPRTIASCGLPLVRSQTKTHDPAGVCDVPQPV